MKKTKAIGTKEKWGLGVVIAVFALFLTLSYTATAGLSFWEGVQAIVGNRIADKVELPSFDLSENFGAMSGPNIYSSFVNFNGVEHFYHSSGLDQASTTVCSFKSPSATSTLTDAWISLSTGTSTTIQLEIGKSAQPDATTTSLGKIILTASQKITFSASTTPGSFAGGVSATVPLDPVYVFAPSTYLNFKYGGAIGTTNVLVGKCKAEFVKNI